MCNYEEDTVRNDDENDGFKRAHESPKGYLAPRVTAYSIYTVTRVTSHGIMSP